MSSTYPLETVEFAAVTVKVDGVETQTAVTLAVVPHNNRPTTWAAPVSLAGKIGFMVTGYVLGDWDVWAKVVSTPEQPVVLVGSFRVT